MKKWIPIVLLLTGVLRGYTQEPAEDYSWWNRQHGWEEGDRGWRNWIIMSPGYMGPNALPVPLVQKGILRDMGEAELTASWHFHKGDPTSDLSALIYIPFGKKVAIEVYGVAIEKFAFSEKIRNERFARIKDGKGVAVGDLYFSTLIQLVRGRRFPNTLLRFATKTASGNQLEGARYTDTPGYFTDLSFSKDLGNPHTLLLRPFGSIGFYMWQTNDEMNLQNDALLYGAGADLISNDWTLTASWTGYSGYKYVHDKPMQVNLGLEKSFNKTAVRIRYHHGLRYWDYNTFRASVIWRFKGF